MEANTSQEPSVVAECAPEPILARCDFCGKPFSAPVWNSRTCFACSSRGYPDQGAMPWDAYMRVLGALLREAGRKQPTRGAARGSNRLNQKGDSPKHGKK